eukprot:CAMPEP_0183512424 /NCGR_PEP_ID=MMETSP0371-20130417/11543_1 /TAXON_ID=268820 /ORGANISM="Peridinium aciculiferum, Strain PAER-2" /LENGTH=128 /DNA_ID=CAMNT_0025709493 /DNA_START=104 /DNA_END=491 /DNA_ORIENTATION=+
MSWILLGMGLVAAAAASLGWFECESRVGLVKDTGLAGSWVPSMDERAFSIVLRQWSWNCGIELDRLAVYSSPASPPLIHNDDARVRRKHTPFVALFTALSSESVLPVVGATCLYRLLRRAKINPEQAD